MGAGRGRSGLWLPWLFALLPALAGLLAALWVQRSELAGSLVQLRYELTQVLALGGLAVSLLVVALLIARRTRRRGLAQAVAQEAQRHRAEHRRFTRRLDHELKNPLTTMAAALANIRAADASPGVLGEVANVQTQTARLVRLTDDLRKLDAFEEQPLERERIALKELFSELEALCELTPEFADRRLSLALPDAPWPVPDVQADRELIVLALYNLLDNAAKYSGAGDTIEVRASEERGYARIDIADTGVGVAEGEQGLVFDELYRGRNVRGREGSGMGLTLVRRIVERHGGSVVIDSKEAVGTRVTVRLPLGG